MANYQINNTYRAVSFEHRPHCLDTRITNTLIMRAMIITTTTDTTDAPVMAITLLVLLSLWQASAIAGGKIIL